MSLFTADDIGPWLARHNITPSDYQTEFNKWTAQGYFPLVVQAGGTDATSARFAALFVKSEHTIAKAFLANGPVANAQIDRVMQQTMQQYPLARHASLAIVHGKKLVYARGYTLAEAGLAHCAAYNAFPVGKRVEDDHRTCRVSINTGGQAIAFRYFTKRTPTQNAVRRRANGLTVQQSDHSASFGAQERHRHRLVR